MPTNDRTARATRTARRGARSRARGSYCDRKEFAEALRRRTADAMAATDEGEGEEDEDDVGSVVVVEKMEDDETLKKEEQLAVASSCQVEHGNEIGRAHV